MRLAVAEEVAPHPTFPILATRIEGEQSSLGSPSGDVFATIPHEAATIAPFVRSPHTSQSTVTLTVSGENYDGSSAVLSEQLRVLGLSRNIRRFTISDLLVMVMLVPLAGAPPWFFAFVSVATLLVHKTACVMLNEWPVADVAVPLRRAVFQFSPFLRRFPSKRSRCNY